VFTPGSFSTSRNHAFTSSIYFAILGCAERIGATTPFTSPILVLLVQDLMGTPLS
jgi:hypothetical protein